MTVDEAKANRELRSSFSWRTIAAAVGMVATFLLTVVVVRTLDARDASAFFAVLAALSIGPLIGRLGLGPNVIRLIPAEPDHESRRRAAGTHLFATFLLSSASAPVVALCATAGLIGHGDFVIVLILTTVVIVVESVRLMLSDIFAAYGRVGASVGTMHYIRSAIVLPVIGLLAVTLERPTLALLLSAYAIVATVQLLVALWIARQDVGYTKIFGVSTLKTAIYSGTRLFSLELSAFLMMSGTIWLASAAFSPVTATHYSAAATIASQVTILESLTALAVTPPAARLWAAGKKTEVVRTLSNAATLNTLVTIVVVIVMAAFSGFFLQIAYGQGMKSAALLLVILAISGIFQAALNVNIAILIISNHLREVSRTATLVLIAFVPCALAAAYFGGPVALAITSSAGVAALSVAEALTAKHSLPRAPHAHLGVARAVRELTASTHG
ncbi:MATE family efflux transporter [Williamsia sterculiae]|uniref:Membrane protein involved in the export of O-antigen and teichoic acid n=1 Tax=Williamsia sterculiae TaxID=1344003 RepID=A0A1N7CI18_9NOCA|nr:teichoic acid transporter [Williamsia sterculiae]SIR63222.1 Membrane protein involved in the export of O-antigen and teichoic acid [Williamsia sterculiae]